jgi:transposase
VFAFDEARFGLKVWHRRRWCPSGARPPWPYEHRYQWLWLYAAVEPITGACFVLFLPRVDSACLEAFLRAFRQVVPDGSVALVLDGSGSHTSRRVTWPEGVEALPLPAYSPELNPAERLFEVLRGALANQVFDGLEALEQALTAALRPYWHDPARLRRLTAYPWWRDAVRTITTSAT